jgi:hypothetical protein
MYCVDSFYPLWFDECTVSRPWSCSAPQSDDYLTCTCKLKPVTPTILPTPTPTSPTMTPSFRPTFEPSVRPSRGPTYGPSRVPTTSRPTLSPTATPSSVSPTLVPSRRPSPEPTSRSPTFSPSTRPSPEPTSRRPTFSPSTRPSPEPTTRRPTFSPSTRPSPEPTTRRPTVSPSTRPSSQPVARIPTVSPVIRRRVLQGIPNDVYLSSACKLQLSSSAASLSLVYPDRFCSQNLVENTCSMVVDMDNDPSVRSCSDYCNLFDLDCKSSYYNGWGECYITEELSCRNNFNHSRSVSVISDQLTHFHEYLNLQ